MFKRKLNEEELRTEYDLMLLILLPIDTEYMQNDIGIFFFLNEIFYIFFEMEYFISINNM